MKKILLTISFALVFFAQAGFACTLAIKPLSGFDKTEYIFIGEVTGYTAEPVKSEKLRGEAHGLIVKVKESVYLPKTPKTHFEIFPFQLWSDCSDAGASLRELKKSFPLNSEIRVIAKEAERLPRALPDGNIRLEDRADELGSIALNYDENKNRLSFAGSVFDYKSFKYDINENSAAKYRLPDFEARKDLLRLANSKTRAEKSSILARLLYFPVGGRLDIYAIFKEHSESKDAYEHLYCKRLLEIEGLSSDEFEALKKDLPKVCSQYKNKG